MATASSAQTDERARLLAEIAQLEQELAHSPRLHQLNDAEGISGGVGTKRARDAREQLDATTIHENLTLALEAGLAGRGQAKDGSGAAHVELKRAQRMLESNIEFTGIRLTSSKSKIISSDTASQLRLHTLSGTVDPAPSPVSFRLKLYVREPAAEADKEQTREGAGREYAVERMESEVDGASRELHDGVSELGLEEQPHPPAFFAALRQWATLSTARADLFSALRLAFPRYVAQARSSRPTAVETDLTFSSTSNAPTLVLSYLLQPNPASYALRTAQPLIPHLSLRADIPPSLPPAARQALEAIPQQFDRMLQEGFEPQRAVDAIVRAMFEGDAAEA